MDLILTILIILWLLAVAPVAVAAHERGRSALAWALAATLYSPPLAALFLIAFPMRERR